MEHLHEWRWWPVGIIGGGETDSSDEEDSEKLRVSRCSHGTKVYKGRKETCIGGLWYHKKCNILYITIIEPVYIQSVKLKSYDTDSYINEEWKMCQLAIWNFKINTNY